MAELFNFPDRPRTHNVLPKIRVKFAATSVDAVRRVLDRIQYGDCYFARLPNRRVAVDHTGKMIVIFPSDALAVAFMADLSAIGITSVAQYWVQQTGNRLVGAEPSPPYISQ